MSICERPSNGIESCPTTAFGLEQCSIFPDRERLVYQAKKLKQTREAVQEKLEEYRQQYEQMEIRAIAAEAENQSLKLQKNDLESKLKQSEKSMQSMSGRLNTFRRATTEKGASLERFHSKLSEIRKAMTKEVEKLRQSEKNLLQILDNFRSKVTEFRNNAVSKDEFLSAVDTVFNEQSELFKKDSNCEDHSPSPPPLPPKLVSTTSVPIDDQVLQERDDQDEVRMKPVVPPRKHSLLSGQSSLSVEYFPKPSFDHTLITSKQPRSPHKRNGHVTNPVRGLYDLSTPNLPAAFSYHKTNPYDSKDDTDSSSDFEIFTPPSRKRYTSEHVPHSSSHRSLERNVSSPVPLPRNVSKETSVPIKKSSPILTKRPAWLTKKWQSFNSPGDERSRMMSPERKALRSKIRSRSLDNNSVQGLHKSLSEANIHAHNSEERSNLVESGDDTGSSANSFEYVSSWKLRKAIGIEDGSAFSGSLPHLDAVGHHLSEVAEEDGEADLDCMYLNPDEIAAFVSKKLDRTTSKKVHKRLDTVLRNSSTYLQIIRSAPVEKKERVRPGALNVKSLLPVGSENADTPTPYVHMASVAKMWQHVHFKDQDESQSMSGYTSDDLSSVDWDADKSENETLMERERDEEEQNDLVGNHYERIGGRSTSKEFPSFDDERYAAAPGLIYTDDIYAVIRDPPSQYSSAQLTYTNPHTETDTWPSTEKRKNWRSRLLTPPTGRSNKTPNTIPRNTADEAPYVRLNEAFHGEPESKTLRPPTPPPRPQRRTSFCPPPKSEFDSQLQVPGIGPLPLYTTMRGVHQNLQLVPLSTLSPNISEDEHALSDSERPSGHPYTLGKFESTDASDKDMQEKTVLKTSLDFSSPAAEHTIPKRRVTHHVGTPNLASLVEGEDVSSLTSSSMKQKNHKQLSPQRSHTFSVPNSKSKTPQQQKVQQPVATVEKSGFLNKMGPEKKRWTRRWFVLKGSELKYYRSKDQKRTRGVVNLDSWCKLSRLGTPEAFQLATPKKVYHLVANTQPECEEWLKVLAAAMQHTTVEGAEYDNPLKPKLPTVSGWAHITQNGHSEKLWCTLEGEMLNLALKPGSQPHRKISVTQSTVRRKRDSILLDSGKQSRSNLNSMLFTIKEKKSGGVTIVSPEKQEDKDSWYYHLSASQSGDQELNLTMTEKLLTQIMQDNIITHRTHPNWKHPVLSCTTGPLRNALTSLPSASLIAGAKNLFQSLQLFLTTPLNSAKLEYHICSLQHMVSTCLKHTPLQDELYCQMLRQISGHTTFNTSQVYQGWFLLYLVIHMFLPIKRKFEWYLKTFLERYASNSNVTISTFAKQCQQALIQAQDQESGPRQCKPSYFELTCLLSGFAKSPTVPMKATVLVPVYLADCSIIEVECTPSTTIQDFTAQLNDQIDMLDTSQTGFALMCDWPGMEDMACCCPFSDSKLCDVISMWSSSLEELNYNDSRFQPKQQRNINFTYKRRLCFHQRRGHETEKEAVLLAHQMSTEILNNRHPVSSIEGVQLAGIMAQIEYGDWTTIVAENENFGGVEREALQRFCPWKFTHLALEHDQSLLQSKLVKQWKELAGWTKNQCAHKYLGVCYQWEYYGTTLFEAEEWFCCDKPRRTVWLAIHEDGVSLLDQNTLQCLQSYNYEEITTFGGNNENKFILVVSPLSQQLNKMETDGLVQSEKLVFSMPQLKICEATFLIASYMKAFESAEKSP